MSELDQTDDTGDAFANLVNLVGQNRSEGDEGSMFMDVGYGSHSGHSLAMTPSTSYLTMPAQTGSIEKQDSIQCHHTGKRKHSEVEKDRRRSISTGFLKLQAALHGDSQPKPLPKSVLLQQACDEVFELRKKVEASTLIISQYAFNSSSPLRPPATTSSLPSANQTPQLCTPTSTAPTPSTAWSENIDRHQVDWGSRMQMTAGVGADASVNKACAFKDDRKSMENTLTCIKKKSNSSTGSFSCPSSSGSCSSSSLSSPSSSSSSWNDDNPTSYNDEARHQAKTRSRAKDKVKAKAKAREREERAMSKIKAKRKKAKHSRSSASPDIPPTSPPKNAAPNHELKQIILSLLLDLPSQLNETQKQQMLSGQPVSTESHIGMQGNVKSKTRKC